MKAFTVTFTHPRGHELGRRLMPDVQVLDAGEAGSQPIRPQLGPQLDAIEQSVRDAAAAEGCTPALTPRELRVAICRALIEGETEEGILLPIPVNITPPTPDHHEAMPTLEEIDQLLDLHDTNEKGA